ncbi:hypothetical protein B0H11DRAFT_2239731 [Mycena galericulata]|nr:hypothetical protein B0H11DRAFT_2239731 [Mycena galericulata]
MDSPDYALDLTRNRNENAPLGPFDSKIAAVIRIEGESYYITTNASYIPAVPVPGKHTVYLRKDMRYGEDDPVLWPHNYSHYNCHLGAIQKKPLGMLREIAVMWSNPTAEDFISAETGLSATRSLGKLSTMRFSAIAQLVNKFREEYTKYVEHIAPQPVNTLFPPLIKQIRLGLERLQTIPTTFHQMVATVTTVQRMFLEAQALLKYITVYKPLMDHGESDLPRPTEHCVGVFTADLVIAQEFRLAGLPYWLLRPTHTFRSDNILAVVELLQPADQLQLERLQGCSEFPTQGDTDSKMSIIHRCSRTAAWYKDPFSPAAAAPPSQQSGSTIPTPAKADPTPQPAKRPDLGKTSTRYDPYPRSPAPPRTAATTPKQQGRDKFEPLDREEMPPSIPAWARALAAVQKRNDPRNGPMDTRYVFPEPALVVSSESPARRQLLLHHLSLMMDALLYRLGDPEDPHLPLSSQEWRDVLVGKAAAAQSVRGRAGGLTKASKRSIGLHELLAPAMRVCGVLQCTDFPAAEGSFRPVTVHRAQEMLWALAESNFRFEFLALDRRAAGIDRSDWCRDCFAGGMLQGIPVEFAKDGLASMSPRTRLPYFKRITRLMCDWRPRPGDVIVGAARKETWDTKEIEALEDAVARHYTQTFYDLFGRAAVIPMRLVHEFVPPIPSPTTESSLAMSPSPTGRPILRGRSVIRTPIKPPNKRLRSTSPPGPPRLRSTTPPGPPRRKRLRVAPTSPSPAPRRLRSSSPLGPPRLKRQTLVERRAPAPTPRNWPDPFMTRNAVVGNPAEAKLIAWLLNNKPPIQTTIPVDGAGFVALAAHKMHLGELGLEQQSSLEKYGRQEDGTMGWSSLLWDASLYVVPGEAILVRYEGVKDLDKWDGYTMHLRLGR